MGSKGPIMVVLLGAIAFMLWKVGIIGPGGADLGSSAPDTSGAVSELDKYKYPAIATGIICTVLFFAWKNTPAIIKYPLVTIAICAWLWISSR